jgi:magnesium transporter
VTSALPDLNTPVREVARRDPVRLLESETVAEALARLREEQIGERIIYFYVTDNAGRLVGVVPTRRLLLSSPATLIGEVMIHPVLSIPEDEPAGKAIAMLSEKRLLALPLVDRDGRLAGVLDISSFTELVDLRRQGAADEAFQIVGVQVERERSKSALWVLAHRFPWLLCNVASGLAAAFISGFFDDVLRAVVTLAFFIPLVLTIAESVAMQSVIISLQALHVRAGGRAIRKNWTYRELRVGVLLGVASGALVALVGLAWLGHPEVAMVVGSALVIGAASGSVLGFVVPSLVHWLKLDPRIASGPSVLALTDVAALTGYLGLASMVLR